MAVVNEAVAEVAEQVAEEALEVAEISRSLSGRDLSIGLLIGGALGAGTCFLVLRKKLETKYNQLAEDEIDEMREHFQARLRVREEKPELGELAGKVEDLGYATPNAPTPPEAPSLVDVVEPTDEELEDMAGTPLEGEEEKEGESFTAIEAKQAANIFEDTTKDADDEWDYEHEQNMRVPDKPFVIHYDERGETNHSEATFVYYTGDDVLCDARDHVIEDKEAVVGEENLTKFGHGSRDKNVVYIRNNVLAVDIEVVKHEADYAEVVHGFVKHSDEPVRRRRRPTEDD
jgi:hypothetical protein